MKGSTFGFLALLGAASTCGTMAHAQGGASADNGSVNGSIAMQAAQPEPKKRKFPRIGPEVGYQYFLDSKTRERFGSSVLSFGVGGSGVGAGFNGNVGVDFSILRADQTTGGVRDKAFLVILGPEYRRAYIPAKAIKAIKAQMRARAEQSGAPVSNDSNELPPQVLEQIANAPVLPYYGASLNAIYGNIDAPNARLDDSGFGIGGSLFAGVSFKRRAFLEARVRVTNDIKSYNFSTAGLTFGLRF